MKENDLKNRIAELEKDNAAMIIVLFICVAAVIAFASLAVWASL